MNIYTYIVNKLEGLCLKINTKHYQKILFTHDGMVFELHIHFGVGGAPGGLPSALFRFCDIAK